MVKEVLGTVYADATEDYQSGVSPIARTVMASTHDLAVVEMYDAEAAAAAGITEDNPDFGTSIVKAFVDGEYMYFQVRRLTPRECWRFMSFSDADYEKAEQVNSQFQLYKQAGNSIVENVLMAIFGQMLPGKEEMYKDNIK